MGWNVNIGVVSYHVAQCSESNCRWTGPHRTLHWQAERDADTHIRKHQRQWDLYQQALTRGENVTLDDFPGPAFEEV